MRRKLYSLIFVIICFIATTTCNNSKKNKSNQNAQDLNITNGKELASIYCQSCHLLPDPKLLDSKSWENGVLPAMGPRLGIFFYDTKEYPNSKYDKNLSKNFYPEKQLLSFKEWQSIIDYYTATSPQFLKLPERNKKVQVSKAVFSVESPVLKITLPSTCMVKFDTLVYPDKLIVADMMSNKIFYYNSQLNVVDTFKTNSPVTDVEISKEYIVACNVGVMNPNNGKLGTLTRNIKYANDILKPDSSFKVDSLARPVQISSADFNGDGEKDYLVCEFGNLTGELSWLKNLGGNKYEKKVIRASPGAIKAYIRDENKDGLPDVWALFSQGDEGIFLFINKGNDKFEQKEIIRFQPIFGSTYFEFDDFNNDGYPDILYTCGDNADYSPVLKPYHGIYIYINDGKNNFKQKYFYQMYGCFKAMARDFDGDGDLDIAAISFFADFNTHPEESFIYLENKNNFNFDPFTVPGTTSGRWLTMDTGDFNGDGKDDIVLGNFSITPVPIKNSDIWQKGPPFIILKNISKNGQIKQN